ncbi:MAG TPA: GntR family transcriptional regulator [Chloroflexota bacterium]|jgi:GntR family transcriptional regulator|nr:GntR family transcriptional regulator [Chloroflexota bacterium]
MSARTAPPASPLPDGRAPLYSRLRQAIRERVTSGEWRPGEQIPTIRQLGELYGVSRITVVQALDNLAREGVLVRWQGKGVFVGQPFDEEPRLPLLSFSEQSAARGQTAASQTLRLRRQPATATLRARLGLKNDERVILLERLRLVDGAPVAIQQAYVPEHVAPGLGERAEPIGSLYQVLADSYGVLPTNATEAYRAIRLAPDQAQLLQVRPGAAAFQIDRTTADQHGRTIEYTTSVVRGDSYKLLLRLSRARPDTHASLIGLQRGG